MLPRPPISIHFPYTTLFRSDPAKSLYAQVEPAANQEGITNASIWVGYAWADEPRNHAAVMVTGDDKQKVADTAEELAKSFWEARNEFEFIAPTTTLEKALDKAIASNKVPFFISDMRSEEHTSELQSRF